MAGCRHRRHNYSLMPLTQKDIDACPPLAGAKGRSL